MRACPRCGTSNDDAAKVCLACGAAFESAPRAGLKQTMLGRAPGQGVPGAQPPHPAAAQPPLQQKPPQTFGGTMLGVQGPFSPPAQAPVTARVPGSTAAAAPAPPAEPQVKKAGLQQTMLGFGPGPSLGGAPQGPAAVAEQLSPYRTQPGFAVPGEPAEQAPQFGSTLPVAQGPGQTAVVPAFQAAPPAPQQGTGAPPLGEKRTMLGVALPGIAPLHPGQP